MSSVTSACLCWTLLSAWVLVWASEDEDMITPEVGQTVTLPCRAPTSNTIKAVRWSRGDPGDQYVLLFQDGQPDPNKQHPSFKDRVDLQDDQMKDGDVSLILKDVTLNDDGAYECEVSVGETSSWESISITYLSVQPPGSGGLSTVAIIFIVAAVLVAAAAAGCVGCWIYRRFIQRQSRPYAAVQMNISRSAQSTNQPLPAVNTTS